MTLPTRLFDYLLIAMATVFGIGSIVLLLIIGSTGAVKMGWPEPAIYAWDAFLSFAFFIQHSGMVRRSFRTRLSSLTPTRYYGAIYAIASGIALIAVAVFWQRSQIQLLAFEGIWLWIARAFSFLAIAVFALGAYSLGSFDMLGIGPIRAHLRGEEHHASPFVVRGPYRWVRRPLYSCILVLFWTNPELTGDRLLFNMLWSAWIYVGTILEERDLIYEFGDAYARYQQNVPMLIPWRIPRAASS
jgi:protein-S-isoprenylcysteine O-methyltransferase Ste14